MLRRNARSTFAPDAFVFPGGTVDEADFAAPEGVDDMLLRQFRAVVRDELPSSEPAIDAIQAAALARAGLRELREEAGVRLADARSLVLFSHWITPPTEPRRYNTHFFVALAPHDQAARADTVETHDERWIVPAQALAQHAMGELHLVYPTVKHLERLTAFSSVEDLLAFTRTKPIVTIMPSDSPANGFTMPPALEDRW